MSNKRNKNQQKGSQKVHADALTQSPKVVNSRTTPTTSGEKGLCAGCKRDQSAILTPFGWGLGVDACIARRGLDGGRWPWWALVGLGGGIPSFRGYARLNVGLAVQVSGQQPSPPSAMAGRRYAPHAPDPRKMVMVGWLPSASRPLALDPFVLFVVQARGPGYAWKQRFER